MRGVAELVQSDGGATAFDAAMWQRLRPFVMAEIQELQQCDLRQLLIEAGETPGGMAVKSGICVDTIVSLCKGRTRWPEPAKLAKLVKGFPAHLQGRVLAAVAASAKTGKGAGGG